MESPINNRNTGTSLYPQQLQQQQRNRQTSITTASVNHDNTVLSNSSTAVITEDGFNDSNNMFQHGENTNTNLDTTIKLESNDNVESNKRVICGDEESDHDLSPSFASPNTLRRNHWKTDSKKIGHKYLSYGSGFNSLHVSKRRNISQLRKQLGDPLPLPYISKKEANDSNGDDENTNAKLNNMQGRSEPVKYIAPIRKYHRSVNEPIQTNRDVSPLRPLTLEKLEEKRHIMTNKWKDLLIKDKVRVNEKLKQLRMWNNEVNNDDHSIAHVRKRRHSLPLKDVENILNLSHHLSRESDLQLDSLENGSTISDLSVLKLQEDVETNSQKLDLIISLLKGEQTDTKQESTSTMSHKTKSRLKMVSLNKFGGQNLLLAVCIIILFICQLYILYYL